MSNHSYWERITSERVARRRLLKSGAALSVGAAALALVGCGDDDDSGGGGGSPTAATGGGGAASPTAATGGGGGGGQPQSGGTLGRFFGSVDNNNTVHNYHLGYNINIDVYDYLVSLNQDLTATQRYVLQAADSVEIADDLTVIFKLKPGQVFQDKAPVNGRGVLADDIKATQEYVKGFDGAENSNFQRTFLDSVEAPDDLTVIYHMQKPTAYLFSLAQMGNATAQPIIPKETLDNLDTADPVGSGPYQFVEATINTRYVHERNPTFRRASEGIPYIDQHIELGLNDPIAIETAFIGGQISIWENTPANAIDRLQSELDKDKFSLRSWLSLGLQGFNANQAGLGTNPPAYLPFKDIRVRTAYYRLTNRQQLIDLVYSGKAEVPNGPIHKSLGVYQLDPSETDKYFKEDPTEAKQLLEAAEFDFGTPIEVVHSDTSQINAQLNEVWAQQVGRVGIQNKIVPLPLGVLLPERMKTGNYQIEHGGQPGGDTPYRALRNQASDTGDIFNNCGLGIKEIDDMIYKSETVTNFEDQVALVKDIQRKVLEQYSMSYVTLTATAFEYAPSNLHYESVPIGSNSRHYMDAWFEKA